MILELKWDHMIHFSRFKSSLTNSFATIVSVFRLYTNTQTFSPKILKVHIILLDMFTPLILYMATKATLLKGSLMHLRIHRMPYKV